MARVISEADAMAVARRRFLQNEPVDMETIAQELAVGRATLYRVVGSREHLINLVTAEFAEHAMARCIDEAEGTERGLPRLARTFYLFTKAVADFDELRDFISSDPDTTVRVMFSERGHCHARISELYRGVIEEEIRASSYEAPIEIGHMAHLLVRALELEAVEPILRGGKPDVEMSMQLQYGLLTLITEASVMWLEPR